MPEVKPRKVQFFKDEDGSEPVKIWLEALKRKGHIKEQHKISASINRVGQGNFGDHRFLGGALGELKIDIGPGYRVYFGVKGDELVVLLCGGSKATQQSDIELAKSRWQKFLNEK